MSLSLGGINMTVYKATWSTDSDHDWICDSFEDAMKMAELIARNVFYNCSCKIIDYEPGDGMVVYKFYLEDDTDDEEKNKRIRSMTEDERTEYLEINAYELNRYPLSWDDIADRPNTHKIDTSYRDEDEDE